MKGIKIILSTVIVMIGMSVSAQWTTSGGNTTTNDFVGIGYTENPMPTEDIGIAVNNQVYFNNRIWVGERMRALNLDARFVFGFGGDNGANAEFYPKNHATRPGELRFVFGDNQIGNVRFMHYNGASWISHFFVNHDGNVGIGTETPSARLDVIGDIAATGLAVNGKITAKVVEVTLDGWSDYVFDDKYKLKPLPELETFIKKHKHLPGIPSEKEVTENGLSLGEMNQKMMEKIEELTLYVIQLQKEIELLKKH